MRVARGTKVTKQLYKQVKKIDSAIPYPRGGLVETFHLYGMHKLLAEDKDERREPFLWPSCPTFVN